MKILNSIFDNPRYISQIVENTGLTRPAVLFHLGVLEKVELVGSEYKVLVPPNSPSGKAAKFYHVNKETYILAVAEFKKLVPDIK